MTQAEQDVLEERKKQLLKHPAKWDDEYVDNELVLAAMAYAQAAKLHNYDIALDNAFDFWPWKREYFKPTSQRSCLVKAAALLIAEIERFDRDK